MPLAKNQLHTAEITGYSSSGAGVCRIEGRAVFVEQALPGETWEILILKVTSSAVFGKGMRLITPSKERLEALCPVFGKCGGCDLLHMSYEEELRFKLGRVNDAISRIAGLDFHVDEIIPADKITRYRNKAIFNISKGADGKAAFGFYRRRSHELVPVSDCLIQSELSLRAADALCSFMDERSIAPYDEVSRKGTIRHLFVRSAVKTDDSVAVIVAARGLHEHTGELVDALRSACPELTGIILCINKSEGNAVLNGQYHILWGQYYIEDELSGLQFRISPESFYQINPPQAERLYDRALSYASGDGESTVLDLYCGAGTITLCLARGVKMVYGAEILEAAVINARENAIANCISNVEFLVGDAAEAASTLRAQGVSPDTVVVDPPRKGLSSELIETIVQMSPGRVVYVSCDPGTLARDLKIFAEKGYELSQATAVDMFPRTCHVETVVLMSHVER